MHRLIVHLRRHPWDIPFFAGMAAVLMLIPLTVVTVAAQSGLTITGGPSVPATSITETSAVVQWSTDLLSTTVVEFGTTEALGQSYRKIVPLEETEITETNHSMTLWSLTPDTLYHYRVRSVGTSGATAVSAVGTFRTAAPAFSGETLRGITVALPTVGGTYASPVTFRASIIGAVASDASRPVVFTVSSPSGANPREIVATVTPAGPWQASGVELAEGEYLMKATGQGFNASGSPVTVSSDPVTFFVKAEEPEDVAEPEPVAEPEVVETPDVPEPLEPVIAPTAVRAVEEVQPILSPTTNEEPKLTKRGAAQQPLVTDTLRRVVQMEYAPPTDRANAPTMRMDFRMHELDETPEEEISEQMHEAMDEFVDASYGAMDEDGHVDVTSDVRASVEKIIEVAKTDNVFMALPQVMPVSESAVHRGAWYGSEGDTDRGISSVVVVLDTDLDGIPDDIELALGTDPDSVDSDGDGIDDNDELAEGDHDEAMEMLVQDPVVRAITAKRPLQQPTAVDVADATFVVEEDTTEVVGGRRLRGHCAPGATCVLYVYSYIPMVLTATADTNGDWSYDLADNVVDGNHTVYVAVTDETGKITKRSNPLSIVIAEARAITVGDASADATTASADASAATATPQQAQSRYLVVVAITLVAAIIVAAGILLRPQKKKGTPKKETPPSS